MYGQTATQTAITSFTNDYSFLSNFYLHPVEYQGIVYPSSEHAFQAHKSLDEKIHHIVSKINLPGDAKRYCRQRVVRREDWDTVKQGVMLEILCVKFSDNNLAKKLLATWGRELVEGNTWGDVYWGKCNGEGLNVLGTLLMTVRYLAR